jgi:Mg2+ and Co2+ transporter CorA
MVTLKLRLREEIHAAYQQGEEGVVALVAQLVGDFAQVIDQLQARIQELEAQAAKKAATAASRRRAMG